MLRKGTITIPAGERSKTVRAGDRTAKGYRAEWLYDAWGGAPLQVRHNRHNRHLMPL